MSFSLETVYEVWNDATGDCLEIGKDRDGLDLLEIRAKDKSGKIGQRIALDVEQIPFVIEALTAIQRAMVHK